METLKLPIYRSFYCHRSIGSMTQQKRIAKNLQVIVIVAVNLIRFAVCLGWKARKAKYFQTSRNYFGTRRVTTVYITTTSKCNERYKYKSAFYK